MRSLRTGVGIALVALLALGSPLLPGCGDDETPLGPASDSETLPFVTALTTVLIPEEDSAAILSVDDAGTISLNAASNPAQAIRVGSIVIGRHEGLAPAGFLREVVSKETAGEVVTLRTKPALLEDAFESMVLAESHALRPSMVAVADLHEGTRLSPDDEDESLILDIAAVFHDDDGNPATTGDQIALRGRVSLRPELFTKIGISEFTLENFEMWIETNTVGDLELSADRPWTFDESKEFALAELQLEAIPLADVVWVSPTLTLAARMHGELVTLQTEISYVQSTTIGVAYEWKGASELRSIQDATREFGFTPPVLSTAFAFELGASLNTSWLLYGVKGPFMGETTSFSFESVLDENSCDRKVVLELEATSDWVVGMEMDVAVMDLDWSEAFEAHGHRIGRWFFPLDGTGTLILDLEPEELDAPWWVTGPCDFLASGSGDSTLAGLVEGQYVVSWGEILGWIPPSAESPSLGAGESHSVSGVYTQATDNQPPIACFGMDPASGTPTTEFTFDASCSSDPDEHPEPLRYRWDWNADGTWDYPNGGAYTTHPTAHHTFNSARTWHIRLEVLDPTGGKDTEIRQLVVEPEQDTTPPGPVTDLRAGSVTHDSIELLWTAPGDDGLSGTALQYDIRYSISEELLLGWNEATQIDREPAPNGAGSTDRCTIIGLEAGTRYYFGIRAVDRAGNWSPLSAPTAILSAPHPAADEYEPDDYANLATEILSGDPQTHSIIPMIDIDWYRLHVTTPSELRITLSGEGNRMLVMLYYQDLDGNLAGTSSGPRSYWIEDGRQPSYESENLPPGEYLIEVKDQDCDQEIPIYQILVEATDLGTGFNDPYAHEPNNSGEQSLVLVSGVAQEHAIAPGGDEDWFRFPVPEAANLVIRMSGPGGYLSNQFYLREDDGTLVQILGYGRHLQPDSPYTAETAFNRPAGDYFLRLFRSTSYGMTGNYRIQVDVETLGTGMTDPRAYEPNDSQDESRAIQPGVPQDHAFYPRGDEDWLRFLVPSAADIRITVSGGGGRLRGLLYHLEPSGDLFRVWGYGHTFDVDHDNNSSNWQDALNQPSGYYFLAFHKYNNDEIIGHYQVEVDLIDHGTGPSDPYLGEPNDQSYQFTPIEANLTQSHAITPVGDVDWFRFEVPSASDLQIRSSGFGNVVVGQLYFETQGGAALRVWSEPKTFPLDQDDDSDNLRSSSNMPAGHYYLRFSDEGDDERLGHYGFRADVVDLGTGTSDPYVHEPNNTRTQHTTIQPGVPQDHAIAPLGDTDWFRIEVTAPSDLLITTSGSAGVLSAILYVQEEDGGITAVWGSSQTLHVDGDDDDFNRRTTSGLAPGFYYLSLYDQNRDEMLGHYRILIDLTDPLDGNP